MKLRTYKRIIALTLAGVLAIGSGDFGMINAKAADLKIQTDVPDLKDALTQQLGEDFLTGGSICVSDLSDANEMALVTKHFNAITFGNELKPDSIFNYSNAKCPGTTTATLNGEELVVPVTDFSRGEKLLSYFYKWNEENPEDQIKIRGHVLTWHSQTPEWFFHEDYDADKPYVSPEVMTKRHEWYIKTVLEHFVGPDSKYKDMFYGWDVVNEAVSDGTGTYRNDTENSSWWAVYHSNEFIINAFRFANKYAPESLELYYNDYNECNSKKSDGIAQLLTDVKNAEGTRIDACGMQGHYHMNGDPSVEDFKKAARKYAAIVGKVQVTEMDFQCSSSYDGTKATYDTEDFKLGLRYLEFLQAIKDLQEEGVKFGTLTVWGIVDKYSWLQSRSNVGGGANGSKKQMPLLFNDDYEVKQAYWAMVDTSNLCYPVQECNVIQTIDYSDDEANQKYGEAVTFKDEKTEVKFTPVWDPENYNVKVYVSVKDDTDNPEDEIAVYCTQSDAVEKKVVKRSEATKTKDGYETVIEFNQCEDTLFIGCHIKMDVIVNNDGQKLAYSDKGLKIEEDEFDSSAMAVCTFKAFTKIPKGTILIDGELDDLWYSTAEVKLKINASVEANPQASARLLWDDENLYVFFDVKDDSVNENSSVDIFIDEKNQKSTKYQTDDKHYRITFANDFEFDGDNAKEENITAKVNKTEDGYVVEAAIKWTHLQAYHNKIIGLNLQVNSSEKTLNWNDTTNSSIEDTSVFGSAVLGKEAPALSAQELADLKEANTNTGVPQKAANEQKELSWFGKILQTVKNWFK